MEQQSVRDVMESKSVAVIGASRDPAKSGSQLIHVLQSVGFTGRGAGVNPQGGEVFGCSLYRDINDIPYEVDLAVLHIPPAAVPQAIASCVRKGVKGVVICSEGFAETGPRGAPIRRCQKDPPGLGMRVSGPTPWARKHGQALTTSISPVTDESGPLHGFIAQSGIFVGASCGISVPGRPPDLQGFVDGQQGRLNEFGRPGLTGIG
jgi:acyl-CoA synthetase (NDP forming)